jgi:putative sigma-54 modulation protein
MNFEICSKGVHMTNKLQDFVERKLQYALGRFSHRIQDVRVLLTDINGPKGGEDIECHIKANLVRAGAITIKETREDAFSAVARASQRVSQTLSRQIARRHSMRRGR